MDKSRNTIEQLVQMSVEQLISILPNNIYPNQDLSIGGPLVISKRIDNTYNIEYRSYRNDKKVSECTPLIEGRFESLKLGLIETYFKAQEILNNLNRKL